MRIRKIPGRKLLPTAWASSKFRTCRPRAQPLLGVAVAALLVPSSLYAPVRAQQATAPPAQPAPACTSAEHRAFDIWIGNWDVTAAGQDRPSAINRISREHAGCVIREDYVTHGGYTGMSMSFYDAPRKQWHQTWMGRDGSALFIAGGLNDRGEMVLSNRNTPYYVEGSPVNRVTWTPNPDGSVRQHWQSSQDGGKTWSDVFDGIYRKRAGSGE